MRDPVDVRVAAALKEARCLLERPAKLGYLASGIEEHPDGALLGKAMSELSLACRGHQMSEDVRDYLHGLCVERAQASPPKRGRPANAVRDRVIAMVVDRIVRAHGLTPTRNPASKYKSACSVVTTVLRELGVNIDEQAVEKIWSRLHSRS